MQFPRTTATDINSVPKNYLPKVTIVYSLVCIALFGLINTFHDPNTWANVVAAGGGSSMDIWNGRLWGLLTNNFIHIEVWHILFNLYWLIQFGRKIEYEQGPWFFLLLTLTAGIVSAGTQIAWDGNMGIGFSGIGYALFGYLFVKDRYEERYSGFMSRNTKILFIVWLFFCIMATALDLWIVGNGAHVGGALWGAMIGFIPRRRWRLWITVIPIFALSLVPAFWAPWQISWVENKAYNLHKDQKFDEAIIYYDKILRRDPSNVFANGNRKQIISYQDYLIKLKAHELSLNKNWRAALHLYDSVLVRDSMDTEAITFKASVEQYLQATGQ